MNQEKIGALIKKIRKDNHLTQKEFAELFGVTYQAVSKWEHGLCIPDIAILKEISTRFSVDINELLDNKVLVNPKSKKKLWILGAVFILIILGVTLYLVFHNHDFTFKTVSSSCDEFNVLGSIAYNDNKTSIYISDINCLGIDEEEYRYVTCVLYEQEDNQKTEISRSSYEGEAIKLNEFLESVEFNVDDYKSTCKKYSDDSLFIEVKAGNDEDVATSYVIPLILNDCVNSTES